MEAASRQGAAQEGGVGVAVVVVCVGRFRGQVASPSQVWGKRFRGCWAELGKRLGARWEKFRGQMVWPLQVCVWKRVLIRAAASGGGHGACQECLGG